MLFFEDFLFIIYEMLSWVRSSIVLLLIVFDKKLIFFVNFIINFDEFYVEGINNVSFELFCKYDLIDLFLGLDKVFKFVENLNLMFL